MKITRWLAGLFVRMCQVPSISGDERAMADLVSTELRGMGIVVDDVGAGLYALTVMQIVLHFGLLPR